MKIKTWRRKCPNIWATCQDAYGHVWTSHVSAVNVRIPTIKNISLIKKIKIKKLKIKKNKNISLI